MNHCESHCEYIHAISLKGNRIISQYSHCLTQAIKSRGTEKEKESKKSEFTKCAIIILRYAKLSSLEEEEKTSLAYKCIHCDWKSEY